MKDIGTTIPRSTWPHHSGKPHRRKCPLSGVKRTWPPITMGIITGLFVGKQIGVFGAAMAAIKFGIAERPPGASIARIYGIAVSPA
jgi:Na+/H+ antiporter 1